ncbi:helix-turn-helix domain-containing protein [Nocardia sp. NPDC049526]|uniref:helix-turn-helix domain-containing protein n=1 Tax=Nocardia sp. NPDC049526 TaxID=3364316 RepID=UPI0037A4C6E1
MESEDWQLTDRDRLAAIADLAGFGAALRELRRRARLSIRAFEQLARRQPGNRISLKKNLIEDMEKGNRIHSPDDNRLELYLTLCGVPREDLSAWRETLRRVHQAAPSPVADQREAARPVDHVGKHSGDADSPPRLSGQVRFKTATMIVGAAAVLAAAATAVNLHLVLPGSDLALPPPYSTPTTPGFATLGAVPASATSPPLAIVDVTPLQSVSTDSFVLPGMLDMNAGVLAEFNRDVVPNSSKYSQWWIDHDATPLERGIGTLTVRNNLDESVRIVRMAAVKDCGKPLSGTYFRPPAQGGGQPNVKLGVNLETSNLVFQEMYETVDGFYPAGPGYFEKNTISLDPKEVQSFTVGAFVKSYSCSFRIRVYLVDSGPAVYQDIDFHGQPFRVTGRAVPVQDSASLSGYQAAYTPAPYPSRDWVRADPRAATR